MEHTYLFYADCSYYTWENLDEQQSIHSHWARWCCLVEPLSIQHITDYGTYILVLCRLLIHLGELRWTAEHTFPLSKKVLSCRSLINTELLKLWNIQSFFTHIAHEHQCIEMNGMNVLSCRNIINKCNCRNLTSQSFRDKHKKTFAKSKSQGGSGGGGV